MRLEISLCKMKSKRSRFIFGHSFKWNVVTRWTAGSTSFALLYDLMYNDMDDSEREVIRKAIALACNKKTSWGSKLLACRVQSNLAPYHA